MGEETMFGKTVGLTGMVVLVTGMALGAPTAIAQPVDTALIDAGSANDWLTYHGSYKSYHYSPLDQINAGNVRDLTVAWIHVPGRSTRGLQSMPLAADGVLYYTGSHSRTFALDGATGKVIWSYIPELDEALAARQTHSPYNRGAAIGEGKVFVGTVDGRLIALDMKTGKPLWDTKLINSQKLTVGFTGAPLYAKGIVVIGAQGGEWPYRGPIFGVDAATGQKKWEFLTVGGTDDALKTWGNESWRTGGGGGWMPGTFDTASNTIWWGTANPAPLYDWSGPDYKASGARPGDNLYTTSVIGLDIDTGQLKFYHQELPHDTWDFDTGELVGRRDFQAGKVAEPLCPHISGGVSWNSGSYNPATGMYYKLGQEWCMTLEVVKTTPITEPQAQLNLGAVFKIAPPPGGEIYGHLDARDPITGAKKWEVRFPEPPLGSVLSTGGNLVFVPDSRGTVHAYDAESGAELWSHGDGTGHQGGIISYAANGKQYIAVVAGF